jgi:hypothetical protein
MNRPAGSDTLLKTFMRSTRPCEQNSTGIKSPGTNFRRGWVVAGYGSNSPPMPLSTSSQQVRPEIIYYLAKKFLRCILSQRSSACLRVEPHDMGTKPLLLTEWYTSNSQTLASSRQITSCPKYNEDILGSSTSGWISAGSDILSNTRRGRGIKPLWCPEYTETPSISGVCFYFLIYIYIYTHIYIYVYIYIYSFIKTFGPLLNQKNGNCNWV